MLERPEELGDPGRGVGRRVTWPPCCTGRRAAACARRDAADLLDRRPEQEEELEAASSDKPSAGTSTDGVGHASDRMQRRVRCSPGSNTSRPCVFWARLDQHVHCVSLASSAG